MLILLLLGLLLLVCKSTLLSVWLRIIVAIDRIRLVLWLMLLMLLLLWMIPMVTATAANTTARRRGAGN